MVRNNEGEREERGHARSVDPSPKHIKVKDHSICIDKQSLVGGTYQGWLLQLLCLLFCHSKQLLPELKWDRDRDRDHLFRAILARLFCSTAPECNCCVRFNCPLFVGRRKCKRTIAIKSNSARSGGINRCVCYLCSRLVCVRDGSASCLEAVRLSGWSRFVSSWCL